MSDQWVAGFKEPLPPPTSFDYQRLPISKLESQKAEAFAKAVEMGASRN